DDSIFESITDAWRDLSGLPDAFVRKGGTTLGAVAASAICPPGWCGYVRIGDGIVMTAPDLRRAERLSEAAFRSAPEAGRLGPAVLAFLDHPVVRPSGDVAEVTATDPAILDLEHAVGPAEAGEAGIGQSLSPVFVAINQRALVAAAGYRPWLDRLAHI